MSDYPAPVFPDYFPDVSGLGNLAIENVFYEYEEPILFVCTDEQGKRYLCSCCLLSENWLVGNVSNRQLIDMIDKKIAVSEVFRQCQSLFFLFWDGETLSCSRSVPEDAYPREGAFLRLSSERTAAYRKKLESEEMPVVQSYSYSNFVRMADNLRMPGF